MATESKAAFARRHGVTRQAVDGWVRRKWIVLLDGAVDVERSNKKLAQHRDSADARIVNRKPKTAPKIDKAAAPAPPPVDAPAADETPEAAAERIVRELGGDMSTEAARRVKENYLARLSRLQFERESGALVPIADVARDVADRLAMVRNRLLAIPAGHAPRLARITAPAQMRDALRALMTDALESITEEAARDAR